MTRIAIFLVLVGVASIGLAARPGEPIWFSSWLYTWVGLSLIWTAIVTYASTEEGRMGPVKIPTPLLFYVVNPLLLGMLLGLFMALQATMVDRALDTGSERTEVLPVPAAQGTLYVVETFGETTYSYQVGGQIFRVARQWDLFGPSLSDFRVVEYAPNDPKTHRLLGERRLTTALLGITAVCGLATLVSVGVWMYRTRAEYESV
ncbi:MAG: hypothetical protein NZ518_02845 [Dehalococcoidia bacterium]|nr:hypothetical protein [Dehalococcoidia bacterium]